MVSQGIVNQFCRSGAIERSIETVREALRERAQTLCEALPRELPDARFVAPAGRLLPVGRPARRAPTSTPCSRPPPSAACSSSRARTSCSRAASHRCAWPTPASRRRRSRRASTRLAEAYAEVGAGAGPMRRDEVRALGELAGEAAAGVADQVREVHDGIAERVFGVRRARRRAPVRVVHDRRRRRAPTPAAAGADRRAVVRSGAMRAQPDPPAATRRRSSRHAAGRLAVGALNGAWGDPLAAARQRARAER